MGKHTAQLRCVDFYFCDEKKPDFAHFSVHADCTVEWVYTYQECAIGRLDDKIPCVLFIGVLCYC